MKDIIPKEQLCDSGCGQQALFFSKGTGRYRCSKSANSCPSNKVKNSKGLKKAHKKGIMRSFTDEDREKSQINHRRNLLKEKSFEELGKTLRKKIVMEDQDFKCLHCNLNEWMGLRITLELDHIDGNRNNNKEKTLDVYVQIVTV